ncbi:hypothetical protein A9Q81_21960 [Gammaproteobacteria bacterium 42_54_T18]|nr:hypothetical protein A9Q81_21960 [Gammaproteobacteria bacterium 42_54_T18]
MDLETLIKNARRNEELLRQLQAMELKLLACRQWQDLFDVLFDQLPHTFNIEKLEISIIDPDRRAQASIERQLGPLSNNKWPLVLKKKLYKDDIDRRMLQKRDLTHLGFASGLQLPLPKQDQYFGHVRLLSRDKDRFQPDMGTDFLAHLVAIIAACFELVMQTEEIARLAYTDPLTEVTNRRGFHHAFQQEVARAKRQESLLGFALLDIDHFKLINDTHGHLSGDRILKQLCSLLTQVLRPSDHIGRMGGEEFMLLLPGCDNSHLATIMERIRDIISHTPFANIDGEAVVVTVSGGIGTATNQQLRDMSFEDITRYLDESLYQAKETGRNKMVQAQFKNSRQQHCTT